MKLVRFADIPQILASHEDPSNPGVMKKVLLTVAAGIEGKIQMINWATLLPGKSFRLHYHEDMWEIFMMIGDGSVAVIDGQEIPVNRGDMLVVEPGEQHEMKNPTQAVIEYIVVGIAGDKKGKSVNV
jgi:mannose-6-phosphate isomerase-like protein (cupin superfamily)